MQVEVALDYADNLVVSHTGRHLSNLQTAIFRGAWRGQKYEDIAQDNYCSDSHAKMVGANLWDILSQELGEKVTKKNLRAVLERRYSQIQKQQSPTLTAQNQPTQDGSSHDTVPALNLELPEGQVELNSLFYIERQPLEQQCYQTVLKPGSLIRIKAPCQMGKTSLMTRILAQAASKGYRTVVLDFQLAEQRIFQDLDLFLQWFCASVGLGLQLPNKVREYWDDIFGSKISSTAYFKEYLLTEIEQPLVLALEKVDLVFGHATLADDFFSLLRAWHEEAKNNPIFKKLRLVLVHSTEVYIPLNINQSPFNVGLPVELEEFSPSQVLDLAQRHRLTWQNQEIEQLMGMVGGNPYLVRVALYHIAKGEMSLGEFLKLAPTEAGPLKAHLHRHRWNLEQHQELAQAMQRVLDGSVSVQLESLEMFKLHSMGLVNLRGNEVMPRCQLYCRYFRNL